MKDEACCVMERYYAQQRSVVLRVFVRQMWNPAAIRVQDAGASQYGYAVSHEYAPVNLK
jgi:hypothetical protein